MLKLKRSFKFLTVLALGMSLMVTKPQVSAFADSRVNLPNGSIGNNTWWATSNHRTLCQTIMNVTLYHGKLGYNVVYAQLVNGSNLDVAATGATISYDPAHPSTLYASVDSTGAWYDAAGNGYSASANMKFEQTGKEVTLTSFEVFELSATTGKPTGRVLYKAPSALVIDTQYPDLPHAALIIGHK